MMIVKSLHNFMLLSLSFNQKLHLFAQLYHIHIFCFKNIYITGNATTPPQIHDSFDSFREYNY